MNYKLNGINMSDFLPPYNLGPAYEYHYITKAYSEIWGIDPETGEPYEFDVPIDLAFLGQWAFLYFGECIHPAAPLRKFDKNQLNKLKQGDNIWMWDDPLGVSQYQWDEDELTGFPDRIHFKYTLPAELQVADVGAREFPVSLQVIRTATEGAQMWNYETNDNGKLVIADTGAMEIRGNYNFTAFYAEKQGDGNMFKDKLRVHSSEVIDCGSAGGLYTKNTKKAGYPETGYWIGFRPFCLTLYLDDATWGQKVEEGETEEKEVPTVEAPKNYLTKKGRDVDLVSTSIKSTNDNEELCLWNTIKHYREILSRYKTYYDNLPDTKKIEVHNELRKQIKSIGENGWPDLEKYINISHYIPEQFVDMNGNIVDASEGQSGFASGEAAGSDPNPDTDTTGGDNDEEDDPMGTDEGDSGSSGFWRPG